MKNYELCPITNIIITNTSRVKIFENYTETLLEGNKSLLFSTTTNNLPVVKFKLTEGWP